MKKQKKLSELQAWRRIKRILQDKGTHGIALTYGLCGLVDDLAFQDLISDAMETRMLRRIQRAKPKRSSSRWDYYSYTGCYWRLENTRARVDFCNRQIKRLVGEQR